MFIMQLIGVPDQSEKDEIVKSVMELRNVEIEEGYSIDAIASRQVGTLCGLVEVHCWFFYISLLIFGLDLKSCLVIMASSFIRYDWNKQFWTIRRISALFPRSMLGPWEIIDSLASLGVHTRSLLGFYLRDWKEACLQRFLNINCLLWRIITRTNTAVFPLLFGFSNHKDASNADLWNHLSSSWVLNIWRNLKEEIFGMGISGFQFVLNTSFQLEGLLGWEFRKGWSLLYKIFGSKFMQKFILLVFCFVKSNMDGSLSKKGKVLIVGVQPHLP